MLQPSFPSFAFCLLFFLFTVPLGENSATKAISANDIVDQTCQKCANQSIILSSKLCSASLQVVPLSHAVDLQGLALIAMELSLENATNTLSSIKKLLNSPDFDEFALERLEDCLEMYSDAAWTIVNSIGAFLSENYELTKMWVSEAMEAASKCQEGFTEKEGEVNPLAKENYNLFQLCGIALCIVHLFTRSLPS